MDAPFYGPVQAVAITDAINKVRRSCYAGVPVKRGRAPSLRDDHQSQ
jgi:hypothetical protein